MRPLIKFTLLALTLHVCFLPIAAAKGDRNQLHLHDENIQVPFCYIAGGTRSWPILTGDIDGLTISLKATRDDSVLSEGRRLQFSGLSICVTPEGFLQVESGDAGQRPSFDLQVRIGDQTQTLKVRAAPSNRPISYVSDLVDDIIYIFSNTSTGQFRPINKPGFDQYFRRLQAQGITRLIVWQSPFPYMADPKNYEPEDWQRYERQAKAVFESEQLTTAIREGNKYVSWGWLRQLLVLRLNPEFGKFLTQSAEDHGIKLTASFRPFEPALTKYYNVPVFDAEGGYLWGFLPLASPVVNYHTAEVGFANYRTVLKEMGHTSEATPGRIDLHDVTNAAQLVKRFQLGKRDFQILAANYPPIASDAFVLSRSEKSSPDIHLHPYAEIQSTTLNKLHRVDKYSLKATPEGDLSFCDIKVPANTRYIWLNANSSTGREIKLPAAMPVSLRAIAGNRLGRLNVYWALNEQSPEGKQTRIAPITLTGEFHAQFQAAQFSHSLMSRGPKSIPLADHTIVVDMGQDWSVEMLDFQRPRARKLAIDQLRHILSFPAFDEIFINTRSHIQLTASEGDGKDGIQPIAHYFATHKPFQRLGIDRAFAPIAAAENPRLLSLTDSSETVEQITTWQPGEWRDPCQDPGSPYAWRYSRNKLVSRGVRQLLQDLEQEFPGTRIRAVIPQSGTVRSEVENRLERLDKTPGEKYGKDYYRHIWSSNNHIPAIGEGMTMVDLKGLSVEPVFLGLRFAPDAEPRRLFVDRCIQDLADNRRSNYSGLRSFFYEGQETLRSPKNLELQQKRERIICELLSRKGHINEVILYEAADWTYKLPLNDPDKCGHGYLDHCDPTYQLGD